MNNTVKNVLTALCCIAIIVQTVFMAIDHSARVYIDILFGVLAVFAVIVFRFAYYFAKWHNRQHSFWHKKNADTDDDFEPSTFAIVTHRISSGLIVAVFEVMFFISMFI